MAAGTQRLVVSGFFALAVWLVPARADDVEPGAWWEQTIEMRMQGMSMPGRTQRVCVSKKGMNEPPGPGQDEHCQVTDVKTAGARMTWKMVCSGPERMTGEGEITRGKDSYAGSVAMHSAQGDLTMKMKGKLVGGDCDASAARKRAAAFQKEAKEREAQQAGWEEQQRQAQEASCQQAIQAVELAKFSGPHKTCGQPEHVQKVCARMSTREGYALAFRTADDPEVQRLSKDLCHDDPRPELCRKAAAEAQTAGATPSRKARRGTSACDPSQGPIEFLATYCPGERQALARTMCAGRDFTGMPDCERQLCVQYAREELSTGGQPRAPADAPGTATQKAADQATDKAKGVLKGLFGK